MKTKILFITVMLASCPLFAQSTASLQGYSHNLHSIQFSIPNESEFANTLKQVFSKSKLAISHRKGTGLFTDETHGTMSFKQERIVIRPTKSRMQVLFVINDQEKILSSLSSSERGHDIRFSGKVAEDFSKLLKSMDNLDSVDSINNPNLKEAVAVFNDKEKGLNPKTHILCEEVSSGTTCRILLNNEKL